MSHRKHSRSNRLGSMFIPQYPGIRPIYPGYMHLPIIPTMNPYGPLIVPRTIYPPPRSRNDREINFIGIIFNTPRGILIVKNTFGKWTVPYDDKYDNESFKQAVFRIFKKYTKTEMYESEFDKDSFYNRLRRTGDLARFYVVYSNRNIDEITDQIKYIEFNNNLTRNDYQDYMISLFRDLILKNNI